VNVQILSKVVAELLFCFLIYNSSQIHQTGEVHIVCGDATIYPSINAFSETLAQSVAEVLSKVFEFIIIFFCCLVWYIHPVRVT